MVTHHSFSYLSFTNTPLFLTGVDISRHRLSTCRALARKYHLYRTRLFLDDGATFDVGAPACAKDIVAHRRSAKGKLKATASACDTRTCTSTTTLMKRPFHEPKFLSDLPVELSAGLYDKVGAMKQSAYNYAVYNFPRGTTVRSSSMPSAHMMAPSSTYSTSTTAHQKQPPTNPSPQPTMPVTFIPNVYAPSANSNSDFS